MRKAGPLKDIPPPLELACLKALWSIGQGSVKDVRQVLVEDRHLAYTTVMTVLERLEKRGGVTRRKQGRAFIYAPKMSRDALRKLAVKDLVDDYFDGSVEKLREYLSSPAPSPEASQPPENLEAALL